MPVRIYALAKDLKIDSKELVDICTRAGIKDVGSALSSIADEEVVILKAILAGKPVQRRSATPEELLAERVKCNPSSLDFTSKSLSVVPVSLVQAAALRQLDLSGNLLGSSVAELARLAHLPWLTSLSLANNAIATLPDSFGSLENLEIFDLSGNQLATLPSSLSRLVRLRHLALHSNRFTTLPSAIGSLKDLTHLDIARNALEMIPECIQHLKSLATLDISQNRLKEFPAGILAIRGLRELRAVGNKLTALPSEMHRHPGLATLDLSCNQITCVPAAIGEMSRLETLLLPDNSLDAIPESMGRLKSLRTLTLSGNRLRTIPESIGNLTTLETLDLSNNSLEWLPPSICNLLDGGSLRTLLLHGNPELRIPPEILGPTLSDSRRSQSGIALASPRSILDFYFHREAGPRRKLLEAKVILVGQGGVGKTSLMRKIMNENAKLNESEPQTDGIAVEKWDMAAVMQDSAASPRNPKDISMLPKRQRMKVRKQLKRQQRRLASQQMRASTIRVNIWDFGGQEIMLSTHQFFLTERSLYVLVIDARSGEQEGNLHGWLKTIQGFGGESPIIIVVNKCEPPHHLSLDENRLLLDYAPNVRGFFYVSCQNGEGITSLNAEVRRIVSQMPHVIDELPASYFDVKEELERRSLKEDFVTQGEYRNVCLRHRIHESQSQRTLLQFLHDLGSVLHYDDERQWYQVYDTNVLNPEWVTSGVYRILMNHELRANGDGKLRMDELERILGDSVRYPRERHRFLIDLMRKFDLCFAFLEDDGLLLIPELLSPNEPDVGWDLDAVLNFQYHYSILPRGLIPRFIVRSHHLLTYRRTYWRGGVVLQVEGCRVAVRGDARQSKVFIQVQRGSGATRRRALAIVRDHFEAIHRSLPRLEVKAKVPLPNDLGAPPVDFEYLIRLEREGVDRMLFDGAERYYPIRELLDGVMEREYDVFLCHNSVDKPAVRRLATLLRERGIRSWMDETGLTPGEPWKRELVEAIGNCRSVAVLIGQSGPGTWQVEEVRLALDEASRLNKRTIPVLLPGVTRAMVSFPAEFSILSQRTWVQFGNGFEDEKMDDLCRGIRD